MVSDDRDAVPSPASKGLSSDVSSLLDGAPQELEPSSDEDLGVPALAARLALELER